MKTSEAKIKNLFIEGMPGTGKSTFLLKELEDILPEAGGYRTVRVIGSDGILKGFAHVAPDADLGVDIISDEPIENEFMILGDGGCFREAVFRRYSIPQLNAAEKSFILIDEVGGHELDDLEIYEAYRKVPDGLRPCIGIFKCETHANQLGCGSWKKMREYLLSRPDTRIVPFERYHTEELKKMIEGWRADNRL